MPIRGEGLVDGDGEGNGEREREEGKVVYVLHPNCAIEEI